MISTVFFKTLGNHSACEKPCIPVLYKNYGELYNTDSNGTLLPVCKIGADNKCMATNGFLTNLKIGSRKCVTSCLIKEYNGVVYEKINTNLESDTIKWGIRIPSIDIKVQEEYLIYDFIGFVGTVGGTLGLFVGFSFYDFVQFFVEKVNQKCK